MKDITQQIQNRDKVVEAFLNIENKYNLLYLEVDGIYVWQAARTKIYLSITNMLFSNNEINKTDYKQNRFRDLFRRIFINSTIYNPFSDFSKIKALVFDSGRKYKDGDSYIDIYTEYFCRDLTKNNTVYSIIETNYRADLKKGRSTSNKHIDFILILSRVIKSLINPIINTNDQKLIKKIENDFLELLNININLYSIFYNEIKTFKSEYPIYKFLFKIRKPEEIYITNSSEKSSLIRAAKDLNICVNELQHGFISNKDIISNFPNIENDSLSYFPDRFYKWSNLNACTSKLPISEKNIRYFENGHLKKWINKTASINKNNKLLLVISQPYNSEDIQEFIERNLESLSKYHIIYKIHPIESQTGIQTFKEKVSTRFNNISFILNEESIYILFKKSSYAIGIFSTALFEAPLFNCNVLLLDLPGVDMAFPLIENGNAKLINIKDKLIDVLNNEE